jgi:hypothetical protein
VSGGGQPVDEGAAVAASAVGCVGDAGAEEPPVAVADPDLLTHQPRSSISPSRPLEARQSRAICGVPQIGLPLTLSEVLISTGTPVRSAKQPSTSARNGFCSGARVCTRAVPLACTTGAIRFRARSVAGTAIDMYGLARVSWK